MNKIPTSVWLFGSIIIGGGLLVMLALFNRNNALANVTLPVEITEFFDYRCVHCADFYRTLEDVAAEYGDRVQVNYRYFPVIQPLEDGVAIMRAAEAAKIQGKFAEFHSAYFDAFNNLRNNIGTQADLDLQTIAAKIGLDIDKFNSDRASDATQQTVDQYQAEAAKLGVSSTPTVFIEGQSVDIGVVDRQTNQVDYSPFRQQVKKYVDAALANAQK